ncbi:hypothetical protein A2U01_0077650, partial [Trifolium medium]|nr:hypothetical protein [Trifolium medium]
MKVGSCSSSSSSIQFESAMSNGPRLNV